MTMFLVFWALLAIFYTVLMLAYGWGFRRVVQQYRLWTPSQARPMVTVLVPARNEEANIGACLKSILANDYPAEKLEIIVLNDESEDRTVAIVAEMQAQFPNIRLLNMPENAERTRAHKKKALEKGVLAARGSIMMTTDADCIVPRQWIQKMTGLFDEKTAFVSGPVVFRRGKTWFGSMQGPEFLALVAVGAASIGLNRPSLANGANVAYRRDVFLELKGYEGADHLTSGDDEMLLHKIAATRWWTVRFCADPQSVVVTDPMPNLNAFLQQRRRWASKSGHYPSKAYVLMLGALYLYFVTTLLGWIWAIFEPSLRVWALAFFGLKMLTEATVWLPAWRLFGVFSWIWYYIPEQFLHVIYVVYVGVLALRGNYVWKGRQIER